MYKASSSLVRTLILAFAISILSGCSPKKAELAQANSEPTESEAELTETESESSVPDDENAKGDHENETAKSSETEEQIEDEAHKGFIDFARSELGAVQSLKGRYKREPVDNWQFSNKYPSEVFGVFDYYIQDFDGDEASEMLAVALTDDGKNGTINLSIYENDGNVTMKDMFVGTDGVLSSDKGDTYVFSYKNGGTPMIGMMTFNLVYPGVDGSYLGFYALTYNGTSFDVACHAEYSGSSMEDTGFAEQMKESGINAKWDDIISNYSKQKILDACHGTMIAEVITESSDTGYDKNFDPAPINGKIKLKAYSGNRLPKAKKSTNN